MNKREEKEEQEEEEEQDDDESRDQLGGLGAIASRNAHRRGSRSTGGSSTGSRHSYKDGSDAGLSEADYSMGQRTSGKSIYEGFRAWDSLQ